MKATLILENGMCFVGSSFGAEGKVVGRAVFSTGVVGYQEVITNPCHEGEIVCMTFPEQGCYGANSEDDESDRAHVKGFVCRTWNEYPNNFRCEETLDSYLKKNEVVGICDIDTRALTAVLRDNGSMNAAIVIGEKTAEEVAEILEELKTYRHSVALNTVTTRQSYKRSPEGEISYRLALLDLGVREALLHCLTHYGCEVTVLPAGATAEEILATAPDGLVLSNGPFDRAAYEELTDTVRAVVKTGLPILAVDSGHLLLALAQGAETVALPFGHHGTNPVKELATDRTYTAAQCHSHAVDKSSLSNGHITFENLSDGSVAGVMWDKVPAVSVQFVPDSFEGKSGTAFVYKRFFELLKGGEN